MSSETYDGARSTLTVPHGINSAAILLISLYAHAHAQPAFKAPNGNIKENTVTYNPFLSTLNDDGVSQASFRLDAVAVQ